MNLDNFIRFAVAKIKNHACNLCEKEDAGWTVFGADETVIRDEVSALGLKYFELDDDGKPRDEYMRNGLLVLTTACKNCGNMRFFSRKIIESWLADHPEEEGNTSGADEND